MDAWVVAIALVLVLVALHVFSEPARPVGGDGDEMITPVDGRGART